MSPLELDTCFLSLDMRPCPHHLVSGYHRSCDLLFSGCDRRRRERALVWPGASTSMSTSRVSPTFGPCGYIVEHLDSIPSQTILVNQDLDAMETRRDDEPAYVESEINAVEPRHDETTSVDEEPTNSAKTKATNVIAPGVKP